MTDSSNIKSFLKKNGYFHSVKLCDSLQGSIWSSVKPRSNESVIVKVCNKRQQKQGTATLNGKLYRVQEDIHKERAILKYLTLRNDAPNGIVKYKKWLENEDNYFLIMENGGTSLFEFVVKCHRYIKVGKITLSEWHKLVRIIFKQMVDAVHFMHTQNVSHFDISLENMLINDVDVYVDEEADTFRFAVDDSNKPVQIKICDFGLAEVFANDGSGRPVFSTQKNAGKTNYKSPEMTMNSAAKRFSATANDTWCLGVCLFMMLTGGSPFPKADLSDKSFQFIMRGQMSVILKVWNRTHYVTPQMMEVLHSIFKYEPERITMAKLKQHAWLN